jgi:RHS repeat-associated protein
MVHKRGNVVVCRRRDIVAVIALLVVALLLFGGRESFAIGSCPNIPNFGGTSIEYFMTEKVTGNPVADGTIFPSNTTVNLDAFATSYGYCDVWILDCDPGGCACIFGVRQERTVHHITYGLSAVTSGSLNGNYTLGYTYGRNPATGFTAFYHELDSRNEVTSGGGTSLLLSYPGAYALSFINVISSTECDLAPAPVVTTSTIYAANAANLQPPSMGSTCNGASVGSRANFGSGNLFVPVSLFSIPGTGPKVDLTLSYNSAAVFNGNLGTGWTHNYAQRIVLNLGGYLTVTEEDGRETVYQQTTPGIYAPLNKFGRTGNFVERFADGKFRLTRKDGARYEFNEGGRPTRIQDRNGNSLSLTYVGPNVSAIQDASGRVTTFGYITSYGKKLLTSITDPAGRIWTLSYNSSQFLASIRDPASQTTSFGYTGGKLSSKTDPAGHQTTYSYSSNRLAIATDATGTPMSITYQPSYSRVTVTGRNGGVTTTTYDPVLDMPLQVVAADNGVTTYTYDANSNLLSETDPSSQATSYIYDSNGNRTSVTDALGRITSYTYNGFGQVTSVTDPEGHTTNSIYDTAGNLISIIDASGAITEYEHNAAGNVTAIIKPGGQRTTFAYDDYGNLLSTTDSIGLTIGFTYDNVGNLMSRTDANGATTMYAYDNVSRLLQITDHEGHVTSFTYDANGNRRAITDAIGNTTTIDYDVRNNPIRMTDPLGKATTYGYTFGGCPSCGGNGGDLLASMTDPNGHTISYEYDLFGRRKKVIDPMGHATSFAYNAVGNLLTKTDASGRVTIFAYDPLRRLTAQTDPLSGIASFGYLPSGWLDNVVDPAGNLTRYAYDNTGRVTQVLSPDTGTTSYSYNSDGTLAGKTDANGTAVTYSYDNAARLTGISFPDPSENITFTYDSLSSTYGQGRLTEMIDPSGTTIYHYDAFGRETEEERTVLGVSYMTSYAYDNVGKLTAMTYPSGRVVTYDRDALGRVTSVSATMEQTIALANGFAYDNVGNLSSVSLGNGLVSSWTYDAANRMATMTVTGAVNISYAYDNVGNVTGITDVLRPPSTKAYAYDPLDRLAQATGPWNLLSYTYDPNGNRLSQQNGPLITYTYQANRLATVTNGGVATYQYDLAGDITSDGTKAFVYDQNQRLIEVHQGSNIAGEYFYDGKGRRVIKIANTTDTTVFHYDQRGRLIGETDESGALVAEYVWIGDRPLAMVRRAGINEATYYFHADHLNAPLKMTDGNGAVVWDVEFDPFGNELAGGIKTVENNLRFPGQYFDQETGLHQNYFRDYDPKTGRYILADPIGLRGGLNLYAYVENNPIVFFDPFGLLRYNTTDTSKTGKLSGETLTFAECMEKCAGFELTVTGGSEKSGHTEGSKHYTGQACDFSDARNPKFNKNTVTKCWDKCAKENYYGQKEGGSYPHWHFQIVPGRGDAKGLIR